MVEAVFDGKPQSGVFDVHGHIEPSPADSVWPRRVEDLIEDMDRCGTSRIIVSHHWGLAATTPDELGKAHETAASVAAHAERLRAYVVFQPHLPDESMRQAQRVLDAPESFVGIKLHGPLHQYAADGPAYLRLFAFANEHALPVLFHVAAPERSLGILAKICESNPRMKLILAHFGGVPETAIAPLLKRYANLFIDTCASAHGHRQLERMVDLAGAGQILFGSDATYLGMGAQVAKIALADLSQGDRRAIFSLNARRVFGPKVVP
jgi:predicted TIM-barrel fold metal-dependent hydrolase